MHERSLHVCAVAPILLGPRPALMADSVMLQPVLLSRWSRPCRRGTTTSTPRRSRSATSGSEPVRCAWQDPFSPTVFRMQLTRRELSCSSGCFDGRDCRHRCHAGADGDPESGRSESQEPASELGTMKLISLTSPCCRRNKGDPCGVGRKVAQHALEPAAALRPRPAKCAHLLRGWSFRNFEACECACECTALMRSV